MGLEQAVKKYKRSPLREGGWRKEVIAQQAYTVQCMLESSWLSAKHLYCATIDAVVLYTSTVTGYSVLLRFHIQNCDQEPLLSDGLFA